MGTATARMTRPILYVALAGLALAGCGQKLSGAYVAAGPSAAGASPMGNPYEKIEFGSGETVDLTLMGMVHRGTYKIDGKTVAMTIDAQSIVFTMDDKGCLDGGQLIGKYCKK